MPATEMPVTSHIFAGYILSILCVFGIIGIVTTLHHIFKFSGEISRKLIHTLVSLTWLPMYFYLRGTVHLIIVPVIFVIVNALSARFRIFKSMEREETEGEGHDLGTVYFAICMTVLSTVSYLFPQKIFAYGISVFCLSFGDGAAAIFGTLFRNHNITLLKGKTLVGTISCSLAAVMGVYFVSLVTKMPVSLWQATVFGILTAILELIGGKLDNFAVSFGIMLSASLIL